MSIHPGMMGAEKDGPARSGNPYAVLGRLPAHDRTHILVRAGFGPVQNVGNIAGGEYGTFAEGIQQVYGLMMRHITGNHANWRGDPRNTIEGIGPRYCMTKTEEWIKKISEISGIPRNERLSVHNREQMMAFAAAVIAVERGSDAVTGHAFSRATLERNYNIALEAQEQRFASIRAARPTMSA